MKRVIFDLILILSLFLLPWWVLLVLSVAGIFLFKNFYEMPIIWLLSLGMYGGIRNGILSSKVYFPIIVILIFAILSYLKRFMALNKHEF